MVNPLELTMDACLAAIADAGLTVDDIDGLSTYPGAAGMGMSEGGITAVEDALRIRPTWFNGGGEIPGPAGSLIAAMLESTRGCAVTCCVSARCGKRPTPRSDKCAPAESAAAACRA
jgi:hypothetical protein